MIHIPFPFIKYFSTIIVLSAYSEEDFLLYNCMDFVKNLDERFKLQNLGIDKETLRKYRTFIFITSIISYLNLAFDIQSF